MQKNLYSKKDKTITYSCYNKNNKTSKEGEQLMYNRDKRLMDIFNSLFVLEDNSKYPDCLFFKINSKNNESNSLENNLKDNFNKAILFGYNKNDMWLICSYDHIWSIFENEYAMDYREIKEFILNKANNNKKIFKLSKGSGFSYAAHDGWAATAGFGSRLSEIGKHFEKKEKVVC